MFTAFFFAFAVESQMIMFPQIYCLFGQTFEEIDVWIIILFTVMTSTGFELALKYYFED